MDGLLIIKSQSWKENFYSHFYNFKKFRHCYNDDKLSHVWEMFWIKVSSEVAKNLLHQLRVGKTF